METECEDVIRSQEGRKALGAKQGQFVSAIYGL
jgi:hypothetical protein